MSCGVGHRRGSDPTLLWLWRRPEATAPIRPLAWEAALEKTKKKKGIVPMLGGGSDLHGNLLGRKWNFLDFR